MSWDSSMHNIYSENSSESFRKKMTININDEVDAYSSEEFSCEMLNETNTKNTMKFSPSM